MKFCRHCGYSDRGIHFEVSRKERLIDSIEDIIRDSFYLKNVLDYVPRLSKQLYVMKDYVKRDALISGTIGVTRGYIDEIRDALNHIDKRLDVVGREADLLWKENRK